MCWGSLPTTQGWCTLPDQTQPCVIHVFCYFSDGFRNQTQVASNFTLWIQLSSSCSNIHRSWKFEASSLQPSPHFISQIISLLGLCIVRVVMLWHFADISSRTTESFTKQSSGEIDLFHTHSHVIGKPSEQTIVVARHACNQVYREVGHWMEGDVMFFHSFSVYFFFVSFCDLSAICIEFYHHTMTVEL